VDGESGIDLCHDPLTKCDEYSCVLMGMQVVSDYESISNGNE